MKIISFKCSKVHGYLSFDVSFRSNLTFLTGINGSGKTTAVRAITALLTPSISELAHMMYEHLQVVVEHDGRTVEISSVRSDDEVVIECTDVDSALRIPVLKSEAYESASRFLEREHLFYREQIAINVRHPVLTAIESIPSPMFLDLERRYQIGPRGRRGDGRVVSRATPDNPLAGSLVDSLQDAQTLAETRFRHLLAQRAQLTDELKESIILTAFDPDVTADERRAWVTPKNLLRQLERNESVVYSSLAQIGITNGKITETVRPFFQRVRDVAKRMPSEKRLREISSGTISEDLIKALQEWSAIEPQVRQINRLVTLIEDYNTRVSRNFEMVDRYEESVNKFLEHSGKHVFFEAAGNLRVRVTEGAELRPITALSSGERQIVVILTHLAFNRQAKRANVLIIDEPELSLHLRWQELFVDAVLNTSNDLQLILATHSPSIIKSRIENCVDIEEARHSDHVLA